MAGGLVAYGVHDQAVGLTVEEVAALSRSDVNAFDRGATYRYSTGADELSDWMAYALVLSPAALLMSAPVREDAATFGVMYGETVLLTMVAVQLTKGLVLRTRPYAY